MPRALNRNRIGHRQTAALALLLAGEVCPASPAILDTLVRHGLAEASSFPDPQTGRHNYDPVPKLREAGRRLSPLLVIRELKNGRIQW